MAAKSGGKAIFCEKRPVDSADTLRVKNFVENALSRTIAKIKKRFCIYVEIQDGRQKWREIDFCLKLPVDSSYSLRVKNFVEVTLSRTVSEMSVA